MEKLIPLPVCYGSSAVFSNLSLLLSPGVLLLCTLLSTDPSFFSKHIILYMGIIRVTFIFLLASSSLSSTDYKNPAFMLRFVVVWSGKMRVYVGTCERFPICIHRARW